MQQRDAIYNAPTPKDESEITKLRREVQELKAALRTIVNRG